MDPNNSFQGSQKTRRNNKFSKSSSFRQSNKKTRDAACKTALATGTFHIYNELVKEPEKTDPVRELLDELCPDHATLMKNISSVLPLFNFAVDKLEENSEEKCDGLRLVNKACNNMASAYYRDSNLTRSGVGFLAETLYDAATMLEKDDSD